MKKRHWRKSFAFKASALLVPLLIGWIVFTSVFSTNEVPVYQPSEINSELVDKSLWKTEVGHQIADFALIDQNGERITQKNYEGCIYVADFFFTRCQTICPVMTNNMGKLQKEFLNNKDVKFLSMSVTPEMDSIPVLRSYADRKGVVDGKWHVTTGDKKHIYNLARKSYFAVLDEGDGGLQDFIHTTNFVLIDKNKQIRGMYDGTDTDEIDRLINDMNVLRKE